MKGKHVIVAGNGCSATQFVPIIAKEAKSVTQFVRSKHWYAQRPANPVDFRLWRWMVRYVPGFVYLQRAVIFTVLELSMLMMFKHRLGTLYRNKFAADCIAYIKKTAPPKYHDVLVPKDGELQPGCKRCVRHV
jgi:cation diffusion facilitator CzcD-associated flavoprotein CzcO